MAGKKTRKQLEIAIRRRMVARLYLDRCTQEEIAARLGVNRSTVSRDLSHLTKQWRQQALSDIETARRRELAELEEMERECSLRYLRDRDLRWIDLRVKLKKAKAKLLGLDRPESPEIQAGLRLLRKLTARTSKDEFAAILDLAERLATPVTATIAQSFSLEAFESLHWYTAESAPVTATPSRRALAGRAGSPTQPNCRQGTAEACKGAITTRKGEP